MKRPSYEAILLAILTGSLALNLIYAAALTERRSAPAPPQSAKTMPPLVVRGLEGGTQVLDWGGRQKTTVLYVMSPECKWCDANLGGLRALLRVPELFTVIVISLEENGLKEYLERHELEAEVYLVTSPSHFRAYGFGSTPQTMVIESDGRIAANWLGAFSPSIVAEVRKLLGVAVPPGMSR